MSISVTLPEPPPKREHIFSFRLTSFELSTIREFAHRLNVSPSHLVRHCTMTVISQYEGDIFNETDH